MDRLRLRALITAAAVLAGVATATPSWAQPASRPSSAREPSTAELAQARALFAQAQSAAAAGRWLEAIERFEKVLAIKETPGVVFHLAAALEGAGRLTRGLETFERARDLAQQVDAADVLALTGDRIASLGQRVPRLVVRVPRPAESSDVQLDGAPLSAARWGEAVRVDPGPHRVEATVAGAPFVRGLELREGSWLTVIVGDAGTPVESIPTPAGPRVVPPSRALPATGFAAEDAPVDAGGGGVAVGPIALGAGAVALGVGGLIAFLVAGGENDAAAEACSTAAGCDPGARDTVRTLDGLALGLWIGAGAAVGGAALWWVLDDADGSASVAARVHPRGADLVARF